MCLWGCLSVLLTNRKTALYMSLPSGGRRAALGGSGGVGGSCGFWEFLAPGRNSYTFPRPAFGTWFSGRFGPRAPRWPGVIGWERV